jgi:hypothetical protein
MKNWTSTFSSATQIFFKENIVNIGIKQYNKVPNHTNKLAKNKPFKKGMRSFMLYILYSALIYVMLNVVDISFSEKGVDEFIMLLM